MVPDERIEWLSGVASLLENQRLAMLSQDVTAFCAASDALQATLNRGTPPLDSPAGPRERSHLRILARGVRSNRRLLSSLREPLEELGELAAVQDRSIALDAQA
ncbi:MAG: hypothetical protein IT204_23015 [Fimbriimonadaceae bacterium]|nr:hypothetical protein [Fimbriimonadaceae bacterium]